MTLPNGIDITNLIEDLKIFSWEAADILLHYSEKIKDKNLKKEILKSVNPNNPVTVADLRVNENMINNLKEKYLATDWEILSEENVKKEFDKSNFKSDWLWVLDPLDGTKDFIQGTGDYAMHLALNYKRKPYLGVVLIPEKDELWFSNGSEVLCERRDKSIIKPKLSRKRNLKDLTIVTSKNHRNESLKKLIERINFKNSNIMGSIGCKVASIIRGESDIYIAISLPGNSSPKDWDFAAPEAILKAAGGAITDLENQELSYGKNNFDQGGIIIASNDHMNHKSICSQVKEIIKEYNLYPTEI